MQPLAQAMPHALAALLRGSPVSAGKVECAWKVAVGPAMERVTRVRLEGTLLLVESRSPYWGDEVTRAAHVILARMQTLLGEGVVREIFVRA